MKCLGGKPQGDRREIHSSCKQRQPLCGRHLHGTVNPRLDGRFRALRRRRRRGRATHRALVLCYAPPPIGQHARTHRDRFPLVDLLQRGLHGNASLSTISLVRDICSEDLAKVYCFMTSAHWPSALPGEECTPERGHTEVVDAGEFHPTVNTHKRACLEGLRRLDSAEEDSSQARIGPGAFAHTARSWRSSNEQSSHEASLIGVSGHAGAVGSGRLKTFDRSMEMAVTSWMFQVNAVT